MKRYFYLVAFIFVSLSGFSQDNTQVYWLDVQKPAIKQANSAPINARSLQLDQLALENRLQPLKDLIRGQKTTIRIPLPDSGFEIFEIEYFAIMAPELAKKFPNIHSYKGVSLDNPNRTIVFGFTSKGFHAQILGDRTILIDPISKNEKSAYYQVYFKDKTPYTKNFHCEFENDLPNEVKDSLNVNVSRAPLGDCQIRAFRLALACTGEYAQYHGGTVNDAMSAMNVTMARVNGIYIRELSLQMILVADNDEIIYLDGSSDPYTNGDVETMLEENQDNIDDEIGDDNYDIGHVFGTGIDSGIARVNSPCVEDIKARGVTALIDPIGDVFDVDYASHEMGHQFGARHTQNNSCQRNLATAVEPGSASTIMGYAGICAPNVQLNSDDYFHTISLGQMYANIISGSSTCGNIISNSNSNPIADAGINRTIPVRTPFFLTGEESETATSYNWEQIDNGIGAAMPPLANNPAGPMFRSIQPIDAPTRFLPNLPAVLNLSMPTWEVLPSVDRDLDFTLTVRDNRFGWGCISIDQMRVTTDSQSGPFIVTSQVANETWSTGTTQTITWDVANTDSAPVNCTSVDILLSTDGGFTWDVVLSNATANDGVESIVVPNQITSNGRVIVRSSDNIFYNVSIGTITIIPYDCDSSISYHYQDEGGEERTEFCLGEDVYLDASDSIDTDSYFMSLWKKNGNGTYSWIIGIDWELADLTEPINVTKAFESIPEPNAVTFEGRTYAVKFSIIDPVCGQLWLQKDFTYVNPENSISYHFQDEDKNEMTEFCIGEDVYLDAGETLDTGSYFMSLWILTGNGTYSWIVGSDWQEQSLVDPINVTKVFEDLGVTFQVDRTYAVKFSIIDPVCGQVWLQQDFTTKYCCEFASPTNLQFAGTTLSWDPVLEADYYIVETTSSWPMDCNCLNPISIIPITTQGTSVTLPIGANKCSSVQVTAVCDDGSLSSPSDGLCVMFGHLTFNVVSVTSISPNPNDGRMIIKIETSTDVQNVVLNIYDLGGVLIYKAEGLKTNNGILNHHVDLSSQLRQGVYFFTFNIGDETITKQVIIE